MKGPRIANRAAGKQVQLLAAGFCFLAINMTVSHGFDVVGNVSSDFPMNTNTAFQRVGDEKPTTIATIWFRVLDQKIICIPLPDGSYDVAGRSQSFHSISNLGENG